MLSFIQHLLHKWLIWVICPIGLFSTTTLRSQDTRDFYVKVDRKTPLVSIEHGAKIICDIYDSRPGKTMTSDQRKDFLLSCEKSWSKYYPRVKSIYRRKRGSAPQQTTSALIELAERQGGAHLLMIELQDVKATRNPFGVGGECNRIIGNYHLEFHDLGGGTSSPFARDVEITLDKEQMNRHLSVSPNQGVTFDQAHKALQKCASDTIAKSLSGNVGKVKISFKEDRHFPLRFHEAITLLRVGRSDTALARFRWIVDQGKRRSNQWKVAMWNLSRAYLLAENVEASRQVLVDLARATPNNLQYSKELHLYSIDGYAGGLITYDPQYARWNDTRVHTYRDGRGVIEHAVPSEALQRQSAVKGAVCGLRLLEKTIDSTDSVGIAVKAFDLYPRDLLERKMLDRKDRPAGFISKRAVRLFRRTLSHQLVRGSGSPDAQRTQVIGRCQLVLDHLTALSEDELVDVAFIDDHLWMLHQALGNDQGTQRLEIALNDVIEYFVDRDSPTSSIGGFTHIADRDRGNIMLPIKVLRGDTTEAPTELFPIVKWCHAGWKDTHAAVHQVQPNKRPFCEFLKERNYDFWVRDIHGNTSKEVRVELDDRQIRDATMTLAQADDAWVAVLTAEVQDMHQRKLTSEELMAIRADLLRRVKDRMKLYDTIFFTEPVILRLPPSPSGKGAAQFHP